MFQALNDSKNNVSRDDMNQMMETSSLSSSSSNERLKMMQTEIKALNKFKAKHPLTKHSKIIIEGVLTLIQHLHTLWTPQVSVFFLYSLS
jgi:predicted nucleotidyltransferase component of viral defense system